jgi:hypothetical protein
MVAHSCAGTDRHGGIDWHRRLHAVAAATPGGLKVPRAYPRIRTMLNHQQV